MKEISRGVTSTHTFSMPYIEEDIRCKKPGDETGDKRVQTDLKITNIIAE